MVDKQRSNEVSERCYKLARSADEIGLHDIASALRDAYQTIEDMRATFYFGQYQAARDRAEQV